MLSVAILVVASAFSALVDSEGAVRMDHHLEGHEGHEDHEDHEDLEDHEDSEDREDREGREDLEDKHVALVDDSQDLEDREDREDDEDGRFLEDAEEALEDDEDGSFLEEDEEALEYDEDGSLLEDDEEALEDDEDGSLLEDDEEALEYDEDDEDLEGSGDPEDTHDYSGKRHALVEDTSDSQEQDSAASSEHASEGSSGGPSDKRTLWDPIKCRGFKYKRHQVPCEELKVPKQECHRQIGKYTASISGSDNDEHDDCYTPWDAKQDYVHVCEPSLVPGWNCRQSTACQEQKKDVYGHSYGQKMCSPNSMAYSYM